MSDLFDIPAPTNATVAEPLPVGELAERMVQVL